MTGKRISMSEYFMGMAMHARKRADCVGNRGGSRSRKRGSCNLDRVQRHT